MQSKPGEKDGPPPQNQQFPQGYPPPGYPQPPQDYYGQAPPAYGYPQAPPAYGYQQQPQGYYGQQPYNYQGGIMAPPQQGYYGQQQQQQQSASWLQGCLSALCCCCLMDECFGNCPNSDFEAPDSTGIDWSRYAMMWKPQETRQAVQTLAKQTEFHAWLAILMVSRSQTLPV